MTLVAQRDLLALVLDVLVPASGGFPSAGAVALDHVLAVAAASTELDALLSRGLRAIEDAAGAGGAAGLAAVSADGRETVLRRAEESQAEFFEALVRLTYEGYYGHPQVAAQLGLDPRPLHPRGHRVEPVELPDLARVTARGSLYRSP